jgi:parvulin-like peptidyl-prolyl isomerase
MKTKDGKKALQMKCAAGLLALLLILMCSACGGSGVASDSGDASDDSAVVAQIGGSAVTEDGLTHFAELMLLMQGYDLSVIDEEQKTQIMADILSVMVEIEVIKQYFTGQDILPETVGDDVEALKAAAFQTEGIEDAFKTKGIGDDTLRYFIEAQYYQEALADEATDGGTLPTEEDIEQYYALNQSDYEQRRISHILVEDPELLEESRQLAEEIREKIVSGADTFESLAAQYNTDDTKDTGGDLGLAGKGNYVQPFEDAAFSLELGELSGLVETQFGFHLVKVTEIQTQPLDELYDTIANKFIYDLSIERAQELVETTSVTYPDARYPGPEAAAN